MKTNARERLNEIGGMNGEETRYRLESVEIGSKNVESSDDARADDDDVGLRGQRFNIKRMRWCGKRSLPACS